MMRGLTIIILVIFGITFGKVALFVFDRPLPLPPPFDLRAWGWIVFFASASAGFFVLAIISLRKTFKNYSGKNNPD